MVEEIIGMLVDGITGIGIMVIVVGIMEEIEIGIGIAIETVIVEVIDGNKVVKKTDCNYIKSFLKKFSKNKKHMNKY